MIKWGTCVGKVYLRIVALALLTGVTGCLGIAKKPEIATASASVEAEPKAPDLIIADNLSHQNGVSYFNNREYGLAEKSFREAVERDPKATKSWLGLAATYDRLQRFDMSDRSYRKALTLEPENAAAWNNLGFSYLLRGDLSKANRALKRAHSLDSKDPRIQRNIDLLFAAQQKKAGRDG